MDTKLKCEMCDDPTHNHDVIYLHGRCHMGSPTWTKLIEDQTVAVVECAECRKEIVRFKVKFDA